jgi:hypothetical protein
MCNTTHLVLFMGKENLKPRVLITNKYQLVVAGCDGVALTGDDTWASVSLALSLCRLSTITELRPEGTWTPSRELRGVQTFWLVVVLDREVRNGSTALWLVHGSFPK